MFWGLFERVKQKTDKLKNFVKCNRCGQYFHKDHDRCNICAHLGDVELNRVIKKRRAFRMTLGKYMFIGAAIILLVMIVSGNE